MEYAHSQRGNSRIFSALVANKHGEESAQWSKWFGKYLRGVCKVTDKRMVYHSFRHGFKDMCRECGISKEIADALQGHSDGDASSNYGAEFYPLRPLVDAIDRYKIHGLELPGRA
ncbi:integrase family protein [Burkholderia pseudomallei]|nr:putative phage integrase [Burkholderia pseudomallei]CAK1295248.1 integrase family protein [Burkholderia pseudomallei]VBE87939.1 integrase family protein [Burkholderia pseudomallei]VBI35147.1 integrase family protein [Burkholderia pseudomallei]VBJ79912.1 integrase family protein [Burkholderia pseudomallei]